MRSKKLLVALFSCFIVGCGSLCRGLAIIFLSLTLITAIPAGYSIAQLADVIWTYSDFSCTLEATGFGDGDTVYLKITDSETKGGTKTITVANNTLRSSGSINVT